MASARRPQRTPEQTEIRHLLGLRRYAELVRAAAPLQPNRCADRRTEGHERDSARAAAGSDQHGNGRCRHRDLGSRNTSIKSGVRLPASVNPIRAPARAAPATATPTRSAIRLSRRSARRPATSPDRTSRRPSRPTPPGTPRFGGALFQTLRDFYGTDNIPFTFVSDEFNGVTQDNGGNIRPLLPRSFSTLSQAEEENGQSRIYLGIHWAFDKTEGIAQGRKVGHQVFKTLYPPVPA